MNLVRKQRTIVSHDWHGSDRCAEFVWGSYILTNTYGVMTYQGDRMKMLERFEAKLLKWYMIYDEIRDYEKATLVIEMVENGAHEELPLVEFNTVAKGFKPENAHLKFLHGTSPTMGMADTMPVSAYLAHLHQNSLVQTQAEMDAWATPSTTSNSDDEL